MPIRATLNVREKPKLWETMKKSNAIMRGFIPIPISEIRSAFMVREGEVEYAIASDDSGEDVPSRLIYEFLFSKSAEGCAGYFDPRLRPILNTTWVICAIQL